MSPYLRDESDYYYTRPVITGYGRVGPWSLGTKDKKLAEAVEQTIKDLPLLCPQVIPHLISGHVTPVQVRSAYLDGSLPSLAHDVAQRDLSTVVDEYGDTVSDASVKAAEKHVMRLVDEVRKERGERGRVTVAWLAQPKNLRSILVKREREGLKRNSVRRSLLIFVRGLIEYEDPEIDVNRLADKTNFGRVEDRRNVKLTPAQIRKLIEVHPEEMFRYAVALAVTTAIDRAPIMRIQPEDLDDSGDAPVLTVRDTKNRYRARRIEIGPVAAQALRLAIARSGASPGEQVFGYTEGMFRHRWNACRKRAGLPKLRFKDLRGVAASYAAAGGATTKELMQIMGHNKETQTIGYTHVVRSRNHLANAEKLMDVRLVS